MKKIFLIFIAAVGAFSIKAQNINPENDHVQPAGPVGTVSYHGDNILSNWCIDVNGLAGGLTQNITSAPVAGSYLNSVNTHISAPVFNNGMSYGFDVQAGYFFDNSRHFGVGTGILYMYQQGSMTMDNFHVEYQAVDKFGNTFRQLITANNQIKESVNVSNFNIPILFKYKTRCSQGVGFTADAGLLINLRENNSYSSNASFDYEAIYDYTGAPGSVGTVYDKSPVPGASDLLITKTSYQTDNNNTGNVQTYFNTLKSYGYNVGLGVKPNNNSGNVSYMSGSVGFLVRPAVSFYLSDEIALNLGAYYLYQNFSHTGSSNSMLTDKVGEYNSILNSVSKSGNSSYGVSLGLRFYLGSEPVAVIEEAPVPVEEEKPMAVEPPEPEKEEEAEVPVVKNISAPILFDVNKTVINPQYHPQLQEAVKEVNENKNLDLIIHGYADSKGNAQHNMALSKKRANVVKNYLQKKGANPKSLKTVGHGSKSPVASNKTAAGRAKNRRVTMNLKERKK
jgi:outer membrane protein OmpA-like peptidoglycan-associated protein